MLNKILGRENWKFYKMGWIPLIYHVAMQGTIFNWADIVANILSSCIVAALGELLQRQSKFYMGSYLIDCILCMYPFPKLTVAGTKPRHPSILYHILWAHKYHSFYKLICEEFMMPLH